MTTKLGSLCNFVFILSVFQEQYLNTILVFHLECIDSYSAITSLKSMPHDYLKISNFCRARPYSFDK